MTPTSLDRTIDSDELRTLRKAMQLAEVEIHNPGAAMSGNYDIIDLIDQANLILARVDKRR